MDAVDILLALILLGLYFKVLFTLVSHAEEAGITTEEAAFLSPPEQLVFLLFHAALLIFWPLLFWAGTIKKWRETIKKKKPPR